MSSNRRRMVCFLAEKFTTARASDLTGTARLKTGCYDGHQDIATLILRKKKEITQVV